jgi:hypothetical protein
MSEEPYDELSELFKVAADQEGEQIELAMQLRIGLHLQQTRALAVEWWLLAAAFELIFQHVHPHPNLRIPGSNTKEGQLQSYIYDVYIDTEGPDEMGTPLGTLALTPKDSSTRVRTISESEQFIPYWQAILEQLEAFATSTKKLKKRFSTPTAERVIETYYRRRAAGGKVTLSTLAEEYGYNPSYLRAVKAEYDKAGKWGSKKARNKLE